MDLVTGIVMDLARWLAILVLAMLNPEEYSPWEAKVTEIIGADEIRVQTETGPIIVRLYGIDAPIWWGASPVKAHSNAGPHNKSTQTGIMPQPLGTPVPQSAGDEARQYTSKRVLGKSVQVQPIPGRFEGPWYNPTMHQYDDYNRIQAMVWVAGEHGESLNKELLRKGWAWWYKPFFPFERGFKRLQYSAKSAKIPRI